MAVKFAEPTGRGMRRSPNTTAGPAAASRRRSAVSRSPSEIMAEQAEQKNSSVLPVVAIYVSIFSMIGTLGNFAFTLWREHKVAQMSVFMSCGISGESQVELLDKEFVAYASDSLSGPDAPKKRVLPKRVALSADCRAVNRSVRNVSLSSISTSITLGNAEWGDDSFLMSVVDSNGDALPRLLQPGEEAVLRMRIGVPVAADLVPTMESAIRQNGRLPTYGDILKGLHEAGVSMVGMGNWPPEMDRVHVTLETGNGDEYYDHLYIPWNVKDEWPFFDQQGRSSTPAPNTF